MYPESQHLEYKREITDTLEREVVGFLNSREGGRILIGVDDAGLVVGLADPDGDQLKIKDRLKQNIQPSCLGLFDVFFEGYSIPRNKELMRIFRDLDMVEYLGSGMPRILRAYSKECFRFSENFTRMVFPFTKSEITPQVTGQVTGQVEPWMSLVLKACATPLKSSEIQELLEVKHRETFQRNYLDRLLEAGLIERTIPEKPNSRLQKYRLTEKGRALVNH